MQRIVAKIAGLMIAASIAMIGFAIAAAYLSLALYDYLETLMSAPLASLATALIVLAVCVSIALIVYGVTNAGQAKGKKQEREELLHTLEEYLLGAGVSAVMARKLRGMGSKHPFALAAGFAVAGVVLGWSPRLRDFLKDL